MAAKKKQARSAKVGRMGTTGTGCEIGMCRPQRTQGLKTKLKRGNTYTLVSLKGPGLFLTGHVTKQGGGSDLTFVGLRIDGKTVVDLSFAAASNWGLTQDNPYGLVLSKSGPVQNFTFGWPIPLAFKKNLELTVLVNEPGVIQIIGEIIHGSSG